MKKLDCRINLYIGGEKFEGGVRERRDEIIRRVEKENGVKWRGGI